MKGKRVNWLTYLENYFYRGNSRKISSFR